MEIKDIGTEVNKILDGNPDWKKKVEVDSGLYSTLKGMYIDGYEENKGVIRGAEIVDKVDRVLGPLEAGLRWFGPGNGYLASFGLRAIEEAVFKIPYAIYYTAKTGDWGALPGWALSEAAATILPYGDLIDVAPIYKMRAKKYLRNTVAKEFEQYLEKNEKTTEQKEGKVLMGPGSEQRTGDNVISIEEERQRREMKRTGTDG